MAKLDKQRYDGIVLVKHYVVCQGELIIYYARVHHVSFFLLLKKLCTHICFCFSAALLPHEPSPELALHFAPIYLLFPLCSLLLLSSPHLLVHLYLSFYSSNIFSICVSILISFFPSPWLRNWQIAWFLDGRSSVLAIRNCSTLTLLPLWSIEAVWVTQSHLPWYFTLFGRQFLISLHSGWHGLI